MPKRRVLPFIILGIIESHPNLTGKEITQEFTTEIGDFWKASHSQIYPELKRMLADGWIQMNVDSNNAKEKFYTITSKGANVLSNWLDISVDSLPIHEDLFSLKLFFINKQNDPRIKKLFTRQIELLSESLLYL
ncbi:PadR family transcriptional regulator, partial [Lactobacillus intestinalis]